MRSLTLTQPLRRLVSFVLELPDYQKCVGIAAVGCPLAALALGPGANPNPSLVAPDTPLLAGFQGLLITAYAEQHNRKRWAGRLVVLLVIVSGRPVGIWAATGFGYLLGTDGTLTNALATLWHLGLIVMALRVAGHLLPPNAPPKPAAAMALA